MSATDMRSRKGATPAGTTSKAMRPQPPKRAHTSAASITIIGKNNASANSANAATKTKAPLLSAQARGTTPQGSTPKTPSPNYFGLVVEADAWNPNDSDAGKHAKKNWGAYSAASGVDVPVEENPQFEKFRRQSEQSTFRLAHSNLSRFSTDGRIPTLKMLEEVDMQDADDATAEIRPPLLTEVRIQSHVGTQVDGMDVDMPEPPKGFAGGAKDMPSFFDMPHHNSPQQGLPEHPEISRNPLSTVDALYPRGSMPHTRVTTPMDHEKHTKARAETLPSKLNTAAPVLISAADAKRIISAVDYNSFLLLDLRVSPQYAVSRITGALNLCIPTTLLKRPAYNVQKLADTFNSLEEKTKFLHWKHVSHIIVYDASSIQLKDAQSCINTLKKFRLEGFEGSTLIIQGGFNAMSRNYPDLIEKPGAGATDGQSGLKLSLGSRTEEAGSGSTVAGGCPMPDITAQPANPFFGNIRQNMDLVDGVGQMPVKRPANLTNTNARGLPRWLKEVVEEEDEGKMVSERFLDIERSEQKRMQKALSAKVSYGSPLGSAKLRGQAKQDQVQIAGIEKGNKNRYKDMLPYEHARVRLQHANSDDGCDYINASHVKARWSHRRYIATQAPVPATFKDFWRLIWEQDVRVIVMLTAQTENGQRKSHPYWEPDTYGHFKVKALSEKKTSLERPPGAGILDPSRKASMPISHHLPLQRPMQRRATNPQGFHFEDAARNAASPPKESPSCVVRKLALSNIHEPFAQLREIAQIEYTHWPDYGTLEASELLNLVEQVDHVIRMSNSSGRAQRSSKSDSPSSSSSTGGFRHRHRSSSIISNNDDDDDDDGGLPVPKGERPLVVHCSAGCGRTGTFVTVDAVIDMLKRQRHIAMSRRSQSLRTLHVPGGASRDRETNPFDVAVDAQQQQLQSSDSMDVDTSGNDNDDHDNDNDDGEDMDAQEWVTREDIDLVQQAVEDLRLQRLSMVQNLRQFTLCYEAVMEWIVREMPERFMRDSFRKSYQG